MSIRTSHSSVHADVKNNYSIRYVTTTSQRPGSDGNGLMPNYAQCNSQETRSNHEK